MNARGYVWLCAVLASACSETDGGDPSGGTDTGNPPVALDAFDTSACKGPPRPAALMSKDVDPPASVSDPEHDGFTCTLWERSGDETLHVQFTNVTAPCGAGEGWRPRVEQREDGGLDLYLDHKDCIFSGCGYCIYDISFTARIPATTGDVELRVYGDECSGPRGEPARHALPLTEQAQGARCTNYRPPAFGEGFTCGRAGPRWGYCFVETTTPMMCSDAQPSACEAGLKCTPVARGAICLPVCGSDADCAGAGPTRCEDGVCKL